MEKSCQVFKSFVDAEKADKEYYRSLSPKERIDLLLELMDQNAPRKPDGTREGIKRVARVIKLSHLKE